jgi:hypothetical protein
VSPFRKVRRKGEDENVDARAALDMCDVKDRMTAPRALAHNKFLVICDADKAPQAVWTGSTNWTKTGLCTQANNGLLVRDPSLAHFYLDQWNAAAQKGIYPAEQGICSVLRGADSMKNATATSHGRSCLLEVDGGCEEALMGRVPSWLSGYSYSHSPSRGIEKSRDLPCYRNISTARPSTWPCASALIGIVL